jgi:hypothetical protein
MHALLTVWAAVGPLVGVLLGGYLAMRVQKRHWVLDNQKEEYRELLSTLTESFNVILDFHTPMVAHGSEEQRAAHAAHLRALAVIGDRLFISEEVKKIDLLNRWRAAVHEIETGGHSPAFARSVGEVLTEIVTSAKQSVE